MSFLAACIPPAWSSDVLLIAENQESPQTPSPTDLTLPIAPGIPLPEFSEPDYITWSVSAPSPLLHTEDFSDALVNSEQWFELTQAQPPELPQNIDARTIRVTGSTIFRPEQLQEIVTPYQGVAVPVDKVREAADKITELYLNGGYINSRAILPDQVLSDGVVEIRVVEGSLEEIVVEGAGRLNSNYIKNRIRLGAGVPLNSAALENQLRLLRTDPLFDTVEGSLQPGSDIGKSRLTVRVSLVKPLSVNVFADNYSPPSVGSERIGLRVNYQNLSGWGDRLSLGYNRTTTGGDTNRYELTYRLPLNAMDGSLTFQFLPDNNEVSNIALQNLGIRGETQRYEIEYRQPLIRSPRQEFALSLGFSHSRGQTFLADVPFGFGAGPDDQGRTRSSAIRFGQEYFRRDGGGAWGMRSQFHVGIDAFGATINPGSIPDSRFFSWSLSLQRFQRLGENHSLIMQGNLQLATTSLLSSRQFVIGGGQSVRGYRQNARSGDNGFFVSIEDRITIQRDTNGQPTLSLAPFFDIGQVWNHQGNPNTLPAQTFLMGVGLGLLWEVTPGWNIRLDYAYPLIELDDRGNNAQDDGFYFSINVKI